MAGPNHQMADYGTELTPTSHSSNISNSPPESSAKIEKRKANTMAARRYRQNRMDKMASLEAALEKALRERDALKVQLAKVEGENLALKAMMRSRSEK